MDKQDILIFYKKYKKFMNYPSGMPKIYPVYDIVDERIRTPLAFVHTDEMMKNKVPLHISHELLEYNKKYRRSILFHEFTHILDWYVTLKDFDMSKRIKLMASYSEFHASQIELLSYLYKNIELVQPYFDMDTIIKFKNEKLDIEKTIIYPMVDASIILKKEKDAYKDLSRDNFNKKYMIAFSNVMYYLGKYRICELYGNRKPHNFFYEFGVFKNTIMKLYDALIINNYNGILYYKNSFMMEYLNYFEQKSN